MARTLIALHQIATGISIPIISSGIFNFTIDTMTLNTTVLLVVLSAAASSSLRSPLASSITFLIHTHNHMRYALKSLKHYSKSNT